jgi:hypothetical protein
MQPSDRALAEAAPRYRVASLPSVEIPQAFGPAELVRLRRELSDLQWTRFDLAHRGRYEHCDADPRGELVLALGSAAEQITGLALRVVMSRWVRLKRGDYSLHLDDVVALRSHPGTRVEVVFDASAEPTGEAEVVFTHRGQSFFVPHQAPGSLVMVGRGETVFRYDRYLTYRVGSRAVERLRILLA